MNRPSVNEQNLLEFLDSMSGVKFDESTQSSIRADYVRINAAKLKRERRAEKRKKLC